MSFSIIIPTRNAKAEKNFIDLLTSIHNQRRFLDQIVVIDSESNDDTSYTAFKYGCQVISIRHQDFNHGGTRQYGVELTTAEIIVFLTQDAILADENSIENIVRCFDDPTVGAAYGRQLPHKNSGPIGAHARLFNYPPESRVKTMGDSAELGIKTAFISNSFAAYRRKALMAVGGFPRHTILSEDTYVAAKMLLAGWKIAYCADAQVYHSHDYTFIQEFKRYFDIGVFHSRESWIREKFGQAEGEGLKFVLSEIRYLLDNGKGYLLPSAFIRTCLKYLGYRLGTYEGKIPLWLKKKLSMHRGYWEQQRKQGGT